MDGTHRDFVRIAAETLAIHEPIYEFGALQVPGQEDFADLRCFFPGKTYTGADMRSGPGVDVLLNLHDIDLPSDSVGTVICIATLEHVEYPRKAMEEIRRILKPGGLAIITSVMDCHIHGYPSDYWRFTPSGFSSLLEAFETQFSGCAGCSDYPHTIVGVGYKGEGDLSAFQDAYEEWRRKHRHLKSLVRRMFWLMVRHFSR